MLHLISPDFNFFLVFAIAPTKMKLTSGMWMLASLLSMLAMVSDSYRLSPVLFRTRTNLHASTVDDKVEVKEYFDNEGFNRWSKIYSNSNEVNKVQLDIRTGHQQTIDKVLNWLSVENNKDKTLCDAGCGVGSLAIPASSMFKKVFASDISSSMTKEASQRAKSEGLKNIQFEVKDMESLTGSYDTVTCIDVVIHYPTDKVSCTL